MGVEEGQRAGDEALGRGADVEAVARDAQQPAHLRHHVVQHRLIAPQTHVFVVDVTALQSPVTFSYRFTLFHCILIF